MRTGLKNLGFMLILFLVSCNSRPSAVLDDHSCQPPCWRNISIGTAKEDLHSMLLKMKDIQVNSISMGPTFKPFWEDGISWGFNGLNEQNGYAYFHDNKLVFLVFSANGSELLSALIQKYGEPDEIRIWKIVADGVMLNVDFEYPEKGICLVHKPTLFLQNPDNYRIKPSTKISEVYYFDPSISPDQISIGCIYVANGQMSQKWNGYGVYKVFQP